MTILPKKPKSLKKVKDINLPKEDIRVEKGQLTFLPALKKVVIKGSADKKK